MSNRYLICGDIHLSSVPPISCRDTYLDDLFDILNDTIRLETVYDCVGTIWAGDVFHSPIPTRTSHKLVSRVMDLVEGYRKLWVVAGNHDMRFGRIESVMDSQPLGVLARGSVTLLDGRAGEDAPELYGAPWRGEWGSSELGDLLRGDVLAEDSLVIAHAPIYPKDKENPYECIPAHTWAEAMGGGYCYYGHVHERHGIYSENGVTFCNLGALSRGSLAEFDVTRSLAVATWSADEGFIEVPVKHKPSSEVFKTRVQSDGHIDSINVDEFLSRIHGSSDISSLPSVFETLDSMDMPPELKTVVLELMS